MIQAPKPAKQAPKPAKMLQAPGLKKRGIPSHSRVNMVRRSRAVVSSDDGDSNSEWDASEGASSDSEGGGSSQPRARKRAKPAGLPANVKVPPHDGDGRRCKVPAIVPAGCEEIDLSGGGKRPPRPAVEARKAGKRCAADNTFNWQLDEAGINWATNRNAPPEVVGDCGWQPGPNPQDNALRPHSSALHLELWTRNCAWTQPLPWTT